jgi:hypothetical protein
MTGLAFFLTALAFVAWRLRATEPRRSRPRIATRPVTLWCGDCEAVREATTAGACSSCGSRAVAIRGNREHERLSERDRLASTEAARERLREAARGRRAS